MVKDGKELKIGQDINLSIKSDNVDLSVINPRRDKSGVYKVIFRNGQGQDERDINVNIMGNYEYFNLRGSNATFSKPPSLTDGVSCKMLIMTLFIFPRQTDASSELQGDRRLPRQRCGELDTSRG